MPLRVLFVLPSLDLGGAQRVVLRLLSDLPRERVEPHLALVTREGAFLPQVPPDVPLHDLGASRVLTAPGPLRRLTRELRPAIVFSTLGYLNLALLATRALLPRGTLLVVREANTVSAALAHRRLSRLWGLGYRWLYPRADAIVCPSRAVLEDLAARFGTPRARLRHIPNPIDAEAILRDAQAYGSPFPGSGRHIVAVGRLAPQKGFRKLLRAFRRVAARISDADLWILGEGEERSGLESMARDLGIVDRVHLEGYTPNPFPWMRHASLFVQSSEFEGLPNALLEALACGVPAVAVDEPGGTGEVVEGVPGTRLVRGSSAEDLGLAITEILEAGSEERPSLPERFRPERVMRGYLDLFESLATREGRKETV